MLEHAQVCTKAMMFAINNGQRAEEQGLGRQSPIPLSCRTERDEMRGTLKSIRWFGSDGYN